MADVSVLEASGVQATKPTRFRPISTQVFFSGLITQRSPFNSPADNRSARRWLGSRSDIVTAGFNTELTNYGTYIRRPGLIPYSSATLAGPIDSFYSFHQIPGVGNPSINPANPIDVIVDTSDPTNATGGQIYNLKTTSATSIFTKSIGAGQSYFQGVGNTLYIGDGLDLRAWNDPQAPQTPQTLLTRNWGINIGLFATASGPNAPTAAADVSVPGSATGWTNPTNIEVQDGNYATATVGAAVTSSQGPSAPGSASQAGPFTGTNYVWINPNNCKVQDGILTTCTIPVNSDGGNPMGGINGNTLTANNFGFNIPSNATIKGVVATVRKIQTSGTSAINDSQVHLAGVTGTSNHNSFAAWPLSLTNSVYGSSTDTWGGQTLTPAIINSSAFGLTFVIDATGAPGNGGTGGIDFISIQVYYTVAASGVTDYLEGTSYGFSLPTGETISGIKVEIKGQQASAPVGSSLTVQLLNNGVPVGNAKTGQVLPSVNGFITLGGDADLWGSTWSPNDINQTGFGLLIQGVNSSGFSVTWNVDFVRITVYGAGGPTVTLTAGTLTTTNGGYQYVVAYGNVNAGPGVNWGGHVSSASLPSGSTGNFANECPVIDLVASTDPQVTHIFVFRTTDGGSIFYNIPTSPYPNTTQNVTDCAADTALIIQQQAPLQPQNNPPPAGLIKMTYHEGRVWGAVGNILYYSAGPDCILGNGSEAFPPANNFIFPSQINKLYPIPTGLLVFTADAIWLVVGSSIPTFYPVLWQDAVGLLSYNALDTQASNIFQFTADKQFINISSAGFSQTGFAIGDLLEDTYNPNTSYVATLVAGTRDTAVFIADPTSGTWFRCNWNQPPEGGPSWSPQGIITGGLTAIAGIETSPGIHNLLVGQASGTVLARSLTTFTDNGTAYTGSLTLGSIVLAQPGQLAEVESITLELPNIGTIPTLSVMIDEIFGNFEVLPYVVNDPPNLVPSTTVMSNRWYLQAAHLPIVGRHMQIKIDFVAEAVRNEVWTLSLYGALSASE